MKRVNKTSGYFIKDYQGKLYDGEFPTLRELFEISVERHPDNEAFKSMSPYLCFTYREAEKKIREIAYYLLSTGVKPGDHIAVTGKNSPEWALAYFAVTFAGCVIVPMDYSLHIEDMEKLMKFGDVKRVFIDGEKIDELDKEGSFLEAKYSLETKSKGYQYILDLQAAPVELPKMDVKDVAAILFTSGTTGTPKGVMLTHYNFVSDCWNCRRFMEVYDTDVFYAILPLHHAYTMTATFLISVYNASSVIFGKRLVTPIMLKEMRDGKVNMLLAVPMLFNKMLAALMAGVRKQGKGKYILVRSLMAFSGCMRKWFGWNVGRKIFNDMLLSKISFNNMRLCICGGGPLPASTVRQFNQLGINFVQGYGLTETSPVTHLNPLEAYNEDSVGTYLYDLEQKIVDPDEDGNGTLYLRGPQIMKGYYKNPEATAEVLDKDGWFNTGDVGHLDKDGYLYLTGRAKNIIVTEGGKNVFPEEIEDKFQLFDEIDQVCIVPYIINKAMKSEGIRLIVKPTDAYLKEAGLDEAAAHMEEIVEEVNKNLQSYKKITMTTVTDEPLEMTSTKKVKRFAVIKKYKLED